MRKISLLFLFIGASMSAQVDWQSITTNVQSFSSARTSDLNNDGVLDLVIGAGLQGESSNRGIVAIDGSNGSNLWLSSSRDQIFGSPLFMDINGDGTDDVFIGGRGGEFQALDGSTGDLIWEYFDSNDTTTTPIEAGAYQFYTPQFVPDQDGDGLQDLLQANGGDPSALLPNDPRPAGKIEIISSATGAVLASDEVPDGQETYMSPLVASFFGDGDLEVIFGSGGENQFGSLWRVDFEDLANGDLSAAVPIVSSANKGLIAPPSLADVNDDSVLDVIVNTYDGRVLAISGLDNSIIWQVDVEMGETNASPAIGYFNGDNVPDIFVGYAIGVAPSFSSFTQLMIDGATGTVEWQDSMGIAQFGSPLAVDLDDDTFDEVIYLVNESDGTNYSHRLLNIDFNNDTVSVILNESGVNVNSTPWLGNLDGDEQLDLVYIAQRDSTSFNNEEGIVIRKLNLAANTDAHIGWGAYIGNDYTGVYDNFRSNCADLDNITLEITPTSNGEACSTEVSVNSTGCPDSADCQYLWSNGATTQSTTLETTARQTVRVTHPGGCTKSAKIDFESVILTSVEVDSIQCVGDNGSIFIDFQGGFAPYTTSWNGQASGGTTNTSLFIQSNLQAGTYDFTVTDAIGCVFNTSFVLNQADSLSLNAEARSATLAGNDGEIVLAPTGSEPLTITLNGEAVTTDTLSNLGPGEYFLQVIDANGCVADTNFVFDDLTDLNIIEEGFTFEVLSQHPNTIFKYNGLKPNNDDPRIHVYNIQGILVQSIIIPVNSQEMIVNLHNLPVGIYVAVLQSNTIRRTEKFLLVH